MTTDEIAGVQCQIISTSSKAYTVTVVKTSVSYASRSVSKSTSANVQQPTVAPLKNDDTFTVSNIVLVTLVCFLIALVLIFG